MDVTQIDCLIDSLRLRLGGDGQQRSSLIDVMFNQIGDLLLPLHMKYIISIASDGREDNLWSKLLKQLDVSSEQLMYMGNLRTNFSEKKRTLDE